MKLLKKCTRIFWVANENLLSNLLALRHYTLLVTCWWKETMMMQRNPSNMSIVQNRCNILSHVVLCWYKQTFTSCPILCRREYEKCKKLATFLCKYYYCFYNNSTCTLWSPNAKASALNMPFFLLCILLAPVAALL